MKREVTNRMTERQIRDFSIIITLLVNDVDLRNVPALSAELYEDIETSDERLVVVNLSNVNYIDSIGISFLAMLNRNLQAKGKRLAVVCDKPAILEVFDILKTYKFFSVYQTISTVYVFNTPANCA